MYNEIDINVQYDFFLSTWDDSYRGRKAIDGDFSFLTAYEIIGTSVIVPFQTSCIKQLYLLKRTQQLKDDYQEEYGTEYDCVLSTRPDIFLGIDVLLEITRNINRGYLGQNTLFAANGISEKWTTSLVERETFQYYHIMNDFYVYGHEKAIKTFANMYSDIKIKKVLPNYGIHIIPATHIVNNNINCRYSKGFGAPIRYTVVDLFLENWYTSGKIKEMYTPSKPEIPREFINNYQKASDQYDKEVLHINSPNLI